MTDDTMRREALERMRYAAEALNAALHEADYVFWKYRREVREIPVCYATDEALREVPQELDYMIEQIDRALEAPREDGDAVAH